MQSDINLALAAARRGRSDDSPSSSATPPSYPRGVPGGQNLRVHGDTWDDASTAHKQSGSSGRVGELAELELAWREAAAGRPVLVLLGGDSGVGKTRLVGELERRLSSERRPRPARRGRRAGRRPSCRTRRC